MIFCIILLQAALCFLAEALDTTENDDGFTTLDTVKINFLFFAAKYANATMALCIVLTIAVFCLVGCIGCLCCSIRKKKKAIDAGPGQIEEQRRLLREFCQNVHNAQSIEEVRTMIEN